MFPFLKPRPGLRLKKTRRICEPKDTKMNPTEINIFTSLALRAAQEKPEEDLRVIAGFFGEPEKALQSAEKMVEILQEEVSRK